MTCIHGLDESYCPTCRVIKSTIPKIQLSSKRKDIFKIENTKFNIKSNIKDKLIDQISSDKNKLEYPNPISKPHFINDIPDFRNKLFLDRINELDLGKEDKFGVNKKIPLENPEWKFEEED